MRIALICLFLTLAFSYEVEESGVIVLHNADFPSVISEFPYILVEFYAPWCGHCQNLQPHYTEAARLLKQKNSQLRLAKCDATQQNDAANSYGVGSYPTLFFFINKTKVSYTGPRTKQGIVNWLEKKILPVTTEITTVSQLDELKDQEMVSLVLFSNNTDHIQQFKIIATEDDHNKYFIATGELLDKYSETVVEIHRKFGEVKVHNGVEGRFRWWVNKHARPLVLDFDDRTVSQIFQELKNAVLIFNVDSSKGLRALAEEAAADYEGEILIVELTPSSKDYHKFAQFLAVDLSYSKILAVDSKEQKKAILWKPTSELGYHDFLEFLSSIDEKKAKLYPPGEQVRFEPDPEPVNEETPAEQTHQEGQQEENAQEVSGEDL